MLQIHTAQFCQIAKEDIDLDDVDILACYFAENSIDDDIILSFADNNSNGFLEYKLESLSY